VLNAGGSGHRAFQSEDRRLLGAEPSASPSISGKDAAWPPMDTAALATLLGERRGPQATRAPSCSSPSARMSAALRIQPFTM
jgi:hypothetical protein